MKPDSFSGFMVFGAKQVGGTEKAGNNTIGERDGRN
jgi:hypothetical protein